MSVKEKLLKILQLIEYARETKMVIQALCNEVGEEYGPQIYNVNGQFLQISRGGTGKFVVDFVKITEV